MKFQITDTKAMNKNTLKGLFSIMIGPMKIEGFTYHEMNGKSWIGYPAKEYIDKETGEKKYWPIVGFEDKERHASFQKWCKDQVRKIFKPEQQPAYDEGGDDIPF